MRVLAFVHLSTTLPSVLTGGPMLTGAAVLAIALLLGGCAAPQRVELRTTPITLPSPSVIPSTLAGTTATAATASLMPSRATTPPPSSPRASTTPPALPATMPSAVPLVDATCGSQPAVSRPTQILLACADGSLRLEKITYDSYGSTLATGSAVMHANTCKPNCANGTFRDYVATIRLDDVTTSGGRSRFDRVSVFYYSSPGPNGQTTASYPIQ